MMTRHSRSMGWIWIVVIGLIPLLGPPQSKAVEPQPHGLSGLAPKSEPLRLTSTAPGSAPAIKAYGRISVGFEANLGQVDTQVRYLARGPGYTLWLTQTEAVLDLLGSRPIPTRSNQAGDEAGDEQMPRKLLRIALADANPASRITGLDRQPGIVNYFIGKDPAKWRTGIPLYEKVKYEEIYPGVGLVYYWTKGQLEYDFIVAAGADPQQIRLEVIGAETISVDEEGTLLLTMGSEQVRLHQPRVYQVIDGEQHDVAARYVWSSEAKTGRTSSDISIQLAAYDANLPLVIDPVLSYSTYLGGSAADDGVGIAADGAGNAYVTGVTQSTNFPTANPMQPQHGADSGNSDAFVTKYNASGSMVYSTYLGGNALDAGSGIAVDGNGNAYVTGSTLSSNFPTASPIQPSLSGTQDAFVTKLSSTGTLVYSTYLGGGGQDGGNGIAVDVAGQAYVTGFTTSPNFPVCTPTCVPTSLGP